MKNLLLVLLTLFASYNSKSTIELDISTADDPLQNNRIEELDRYWAALAKAAKEGDFEGMQSLSSGRTLGDGLIHFETLLVKVNDRWLTLMEYQKKAATEEEWAALE